MRLPLVAALVLIASSAALAGTFTVTKTADTADGTCDADCSLREAISAANATVGASGNVINFQTPGLTYTLTRVGAGENANSTGDLDVNDNLQTGLVINGNDSIIDGYNSDRVFTFGTGGQSPMSVTVSDLVIQNGLIAGTGPQDQGGGIRNRMRLTLRNVWVTNNHATDAGGIFQLSDFFFLDRSSVTGNSATGTSANGGGLYLDYPSGTPNIMLLNSTIAGNTGGYGGGIYVNSVNLPIVTLAHVTLADNSATSYGNNLINVGPTGQVQFTNCLVTHPSGDNCFNLIGSTFASFGVNLENGDSCGFSGSDYVNTAVTLSPLPSGPFPPPALMPAPDSIAINHAAGGPCAVATVDQYGTARPQGSACDIGAFEALAADVSLSIAPSGPFIPGAPVVFTLIAGNEGSVAVTGAHVQAYAGSGAVDTVVNLPVGGSVVLPLVTAPAADATGVVAASGNVSVPFGFFESDSSNNAAATFASLVPTADLALDLARTQTVLGPGSGFEYVTTVSNLGPSQATAIYIDTVMPSASSASWSCAATIGASCAAPSGGGDVHVSVTIPPAGAVFVNISGVISAAASGPVGTSASVDLAGQILDPNLANNSANDTSLLEALADVSLQITADETVVQSTAHYSLTVANAGPQPADNVVLTITVGGVLDAIGGVDWICTPATSSASCTLANLAAAANSHLTVAAHGTGGASNVTILGSVLSATTDPQSTNNAAAAETGIGADLGTAPTGSVPPPPETPPALVEAPVADADMPMGMPARSTAGCGGCTTAATPDLLVALALAYGMRRRGRVLR